MKVKDWPIEKAKEEYHKSFVEFLALDDREEKLTVKERKRKYYLIARTELLRALHFGNPDEKIICKACQNKLVSEYIGNGVILKDICFGCYSTGGTKEASTTQSRFDYESKKRAAKS